MDSSQFSGPNLGYVLDLYEQYRKDPASVDEPTRAFFAQWTPEPESLAPQADFRTLTGIANLAQAIRTRGFLAAHLDPLGTAPPGDPSLTFEFHTLQPEALTAFPAELVGFKGSHSGENAAQMLEALRRVYTHTLGYDYGHLHLPEERNWLYATAESGRFRPPHAPLDAEKLLHRLTEVEAFERFLHRIYPGKTRFSIEGLDMLVPMLDEITRTAAEGKICAVIVGMAHRGRLNVLAHILHKPYREILAEFADPKGRTTTWGELGWTGDVKYHMGRYTIPNQANEIALLLHMPPNPSHLEAVNPVVQGMSRAANSKVNASGAPQIFENASLPILIHGDASFSGQGVVAETLTLSRLPGYSTGGCIHIIANNQIGFTTTDAELRSSLHASDLAKGFEIPILHVNADDPPACLEAARTAFAYRQKFHKDFFINLIGYRRYGHNEGDEPRFTQPVMYQKIDAHPTVRQLWAGRGETSPEQAEAQLQQHLKELQDVNDSLNAEEALEEPVPQPPPSGAAQTAQTTVPLKDLRALNTALLNFPADFHLHPKLKKAVERRQKAFDDSQATTVDWATAEELAFASILADGIAIRLTGQDTVRGTFSQRHAGFFDAENNREHVPLQTLPNAAAFEIHNSPLSEAGAIGFEFGYNVQAPERLVLWEAQYGDFINNAQTMMDEFLLSGRAKWGLTPSLVLLLPHGNEGMGPDHSSARIERFLGLAAEMNVRIAYPSTAAQYFHLLRRQALLLKTDPLPLIVFTPKGLLRHPLVTSMPKELSTGGWQPLLADAENPEKDIRSLLLCSGRIYVDLLTHMGREENPSTTLVRLEQLYPFPKNALQALLARFPALERVVWVQEEPLNMGAWDFLRPRLRPLLNVPLHYVGRPTSSSPAEGSSTLYHLNQQALIKQAFNFDQQPATASVVVVKEGSTPA